MEILVCRLSNLSEKTLFTVDCSGLEVGLIRVGEHVLAYENRCPHRGGPVCLGGVFDRVRVELDESQKVVREYVSSDERCLVCPWHGIEFNLATGECTADESLKLRKFDVRVQGSDVYVKVTEPDSVESG
ncbi:nitrite reductase (NAD(P)H) small subunit [Alicyclobacillus curvatus]|nr:nitrite reductase (NAD(P)H) small subunit [Alicyclobacillus curvatus]